MSLEEVGKMDTLASKQQNSTSLNQTVEEKAVKPPSFTQNRLSVVSKTEKKTKGNMIVNRDILADLE